jgi:hypothetical protein
MIMLESDSNLFGTSTSKYLARVLTTGGLLFAAAALEDWHGLMRFRISNVSISGDNGHKRVSSFLAWLASLLSVVLGGVAGLVLGIKGPKKVAPWALFIGFSLPPFLGASSFLVLFAIFVLADFSTARVRALDAGPTPL